MKRRDFAFGAVSALAALGSGATPGVMAWAAGSSLQDRVAALLPSSEEDRWLEVPWRTNMMTAISEAGRAGKPVLLWVMNGNPLGCA